MDAAIAWHGGDEEGTWLALAGVPISHLALTLLTSTSLLAEAVENQTGVPADRLLTDIRAELLKGEHGE